LALVVPGIDDDPFPRPTWMLGHDRPAGIDLHHARTAAHFDTLAEPGKRNRIAARFERHRAILIHRPRHGDIEWLGQVRHRAQVSLLRFPSFFHRGPGGWADPAPRFFDHASVGPRLQLVPVRPVPGRDFLPLPVVLDPSFHFALARSVARQAGIDVKANRLRVTSIAGVELTPRTGSTHHRRLLVIHSHCRRNPLEATKCLIVDLVPRELILARRPDSRPEAAMAEPKVELVCGDTPS